MLKSMKKWSPVLLLPTVAAFLVAFLIPFILGIFLSFQRFRTLDITFMSVGRDKQFHFLKFNNMTFEGLGNYIRAFNDPAFINSFWFTVKFTVVAIVTINIFAFFLALLLTKSIKGTNLFRTVFFMPNLIGGIVLGYIWLAIINGVLRYFDLTILYDPKYGFWGLVILMNWQLIGYMMIIYIAGIQNISPDLIEAAEIDGAGYFAKIIHIIIPSVMPSVTICLFLTLTNSFRLFDQNLALTGGAPKKGTEMLALNIVNTMQETYATAPGTGQAKAVVFFLVVAVIALAQLFLTRSKEVEV